MSRIFEPHPTVPQKGGYIGGGRGGAGNFKKYKGDELTQGAIATGPASLAPLTRPTVKRIVPSGRGGAGNMVLESEESIFQFDEDMAKKRDIEAPVYRIGRGGAGNVFTSQPQNQSSSRKYSSDSNASESERVTVLNPLAAMRRNSTLSIFTRRSS